MSNTDRRPTLTQLLVMELGENLSRLKRKLMITIDHNYSCKKNLFRPKINTIRSDKISINKSNLCVSVCLSACFSPHIQNQI